MDIIFKSPVIKNEIKAISSKSEAHRYLICAALADGKSEIICTDTNADIEATVSCLNSLGAKIERSKDRFAVEPIKEVPKEATLDCNESGSTLRFLVPLVTALGVSSSFLMRGRLADRPLSPLRELLTEKGISFSEQGKSPLLIKGSLSCGEYVLEANVSSQFISGLLFALSICEGESKLSLLNKVESAPYIDMTVDALISFGANLSHDKSLNRYYVKGLKKLRSPKKLTVGGDWSNSAFFLSAGVIGKNAVTVTGLDASSSQGDKKIIDILKQMGAKITCDGNKITAFPSALCGVDIDASQIPDLVPILATVASIADGQTLIYNASRLRLKESDRIESVCSMLTSLGADVNPTSDGMVIRGKRSLKGGKTDSFNDHRIAMSAAIASTVCSESVEVTNFEAINKSYPSFLDNFEIL